MEVVSGGVGLGRWRRIVEELELVEDQQALKWRSRAV